MTIQRLERIAFLERRRRTMLRHLTPMFEVVADSPHANVQRMRRRSCPTRSNTEIAVRLGVVETSRYDVICQSVILCREETIHLPASQPRLCMECHSQRRQCEPGPRAHHTLDTAACAACVYVLTWRYLDRGEQRSRRVQVMLVKRS